MSSDLLPDPNPQPVSGTVTANAGTNLNTSALALETTQSAAAVLTGAVNETAASSDTASSGLNGRLQRIAQRLTSLIAVFPIGAGTEAAAVRVTLPTDGTGKVNAAQSGTWIVQPGNTANTTAWKVDGSAVTQPVSGTVAVTGVATETTLAAGNVLEGAVNETAPASDTASSGLNGRLQRIAQRLTSLIALLPAALGAGGGLKVDGSGTALPVTGTITAVTALTNALPAGNNNIGDVDVATVPADPFGATADAVVAAGATGSISAKLRRLTQGVEDLKTLVVLGAGTNNIGDVDVASIIGAALLANGQVNMSSTAATLVAQRATRKRLTIVNRQAAPVFIGIATVTTANGFQIDPGASMTLETTALIQGITSAVSAGTEFCHYIEEYA